MRRDGTIRTIESLVDQYLDLLYRFAVRLSGSSADADDLVQETFLLAQTHLHQLRDAGRAKAWLFQILRNARARQLSTRRRQSSVPIEELEDLSTPTESTPWELELDRLPTVLAELPEEFREPLILFYFEQFRYREIADLLGCPLGTVMSRLARAKSHLRSRLSLQAVAERPQ